MENKKVFSLSFITILVLFSSLFIFAKVNNGEIKEYPLSKIESKIKSGENIFVEYSNNSCPYCQKMESVYSESSKRNRVIIYRVELPFNSAKNKFADKYVNEVPTLIYYKNSKEVRRISGEKSMDSIDDFITKSKRMW